MLERRRELNRGGGLWVPGGSYARPQGWGVGPSGVADEQKGRVQLEWSGQGESGC